MNYGGPRVLLTALQRGFLGVFLLALVLPPAVCAVWDLLLLVSPSLKREAPFLAVVMENFDAGGQSGFSRALFRILLALASVSALVLPIDVNRSRDWVPVWGALFLVLGLFSALLSPRPFAAETEWETWALLLLLGLLLSRLDLRVMRWPLAAALYLVLATVVVHALVTESTSPSGRVGGVFQEPNILSTFCLLCLPSLLWRAASEGPDRLPASLLAGGVVAMEIWSGSLTGLGLVFAGLAYLAIPGTTLGRGGGALLAMLWAFTLNRLGGFQGAIALPLSLVILLIALWYRYRGKHCFTRVAVIIASASVCLLFFANPVAKGTESSIGSLTSRDNSFAARLHFYKAGIGMLGEAPLLGVGPGGFAHDYPRYQGSVRYFSKFIHCLPLEVAVEWGVLAALCVVASFAGWARGFESRSSPVPTAVWGWSFALLFLHSLSGVQSQFPYLFVLPVVALSVYRDPVDGLPEGWWGSLGRLFVAVALLQAVAFNSARAYSQLERATALEIYRQFGSRGVEESLRLLRSSALTMPVDEQAWFQWGLLLDAAGRTEEALPLAERALELEQRWAAPYELKFRGRRVRQEEIVRALAIDPVNYPSFYRSQAELLYAAGKGSEALSLLQERASDYSPLLLNRLPDFRADDLEEQLVEYWVLIALLAEDRKDLELTEGALRRALALSENRVRRLRRLLTYPHRRGLRPGPVVDSFLAQLTQQIPTE